MSDEVLAQRHTRTRRHARVSVDHGVCLYLSAKQLRELGFDLSEIDQLTYAIVGPQGEVAVDLIVGASEV